MSAKFRTLPECGGKVGFVASARFMILDLFSSPKKYPRIGPEVTVGCLFFFYQDTAMLCPSTIMKAFAHLHAYPYASQVMSVICYVLHPM